MAKLKPQIVKVPKVPQRWQKLLLYLQNRIPDAFVLEFPDAVAAKRAASCISRVLSDGVPGCSMISTQRGCNVYVVKLQNAQKVVIHEE